MGNPQVTIIKAPMISKNGRSMMIPVKEAIMSKKRFNNLLFIYECEIKI
jgi:hypothetical protein